MLSGWKVCGPETVGERPETVGERPETVGERPETVGERPEAVGERPEAVGERPEAKVYGPEAVGERPEAAGGAGARATAGWRWLAVVRGWSPACKAVPPYQPAGLSLVMSPNECVGSTHFISYPREFMLSSNSRGKFKA